MRLAAAIPTDEAAAPKDLAPAPERDRRSGIFLRAERAPAIAEEREERTADDIARNVQSVTRSWAAVLLAPNFRAGPRASLVPAREEVADADFALVTRLGAWLPQGGDAICTLRVPAYVRTWMPVDEALVVPIQSMSTLGWIAIPYSGATRERIREVEAIASGVALDLERAERAQRLAALAE